VWRIKPIFCRGLRTSLARGASKGYWACALAHVLILGICEIHAAEVTATRLDGAAIVGQLKSWDEREVVIASADGDQTIAGSQLVALRWPSAESTEPRDTAGLAELNDGSVVPIEQIAIKGGDATLTLFNPPAKSQTVSLPVKKLVSIRFRPMSSDLVRQWNEIRGAKLTSDALVPLKKDGKSLDYHEGVIGDFSDDKVEFKYDGDSMEIDRAKLAGAIFYRREREPPADPKCVVHGSSGLQAYVTRATLSGDAVAITTTGGIDIEWPIADVNLIDFSSGKILYLSDVDAVSDEWAPLVGLPKDAPAAAEYGKYRRDLSAYGGPLSLWTQESQSRSASVKPQVFNKGLALRSRTELVYRLPTGYRRFLTVAGVDPAASASGNVRLKILVDDHVVFESDIAGRDAAFPIDIDVKGNKRLTFIVDYGDNLDTGDWLNLCDARIVK
jgi:hypothetical protein